MLDVAVRTRLSISLVFVRTIRWKLVLLLSRIFSGGYVTDCLNDNAPMNYYRYRTTLDCCPIYNRNNRSSL